MSLDEELKKGCPYWTEGKKDYCEFRRETIGCNGRLHKKDDSYYCSYFVNHFIGSSNIVGYLRVIYDSIRKLRGDLERKHFGINHI